MPEIAAVFGYGYRGLKAECLMPAPGQPIPSYASPVHYETASMQQAGRKLQHPDRRSVGRLLLNIVRSAGPDTFGGHRPSATHGNGRAPQGCNTDADLVILPRLN